MQVLLVEPRDVVRPSSTAAPTTPQVFDGTAGEWFGKVLPGPDRLSVAGLNRLADTVMKAGGTTTGVEARVGLDRITELIRLWHPERVSPAQILDGMAPGAVVAPGDLGLPTSRWPAAATSWNTLVGQVPAGGLTVVDLDRPGGRTHQIALVDTTAGVQVFDPLAPDTLRVTPVPDEPDRPGIGMPALDNARALTINADGTTPDQPEQVSSTPSEPVVEGVPDPTDPRGRVPVSDAGPSEWEAGGPPGARAAAGSPPMGPQTSVRLRLSQVLAESEWWRLYLDPRHHGIAQSRFPENPGSFYDNDKSPGYQRSMLNAYRKFLDSEDAGFARLNSEAYKQMHDAVTEYVHDDFGWSNQVPPGQVGGVIPPTAFPLLGASQASQDVFAEQIAGRPLLREVRDALSKSGPQPIAIINRFQYRKPVITTTYQGDEVVGLVDAALDQYYAESEQAATLNERLRAIVRVVRSLHIIHPFIDGNGRLHSHLLLQRLLLEQGMRPVIFADMDISFDGSRSLDDLVEIIKREQDADLTADIAILNSDEDLESVYSGDEDSPSVYSDDFAGTLADVGSLDGSATPLVAAGYGRVVEFVGSLPSVAVFVDDAANFGHQAAATMLMASLRELGYRGDITVVASGSVRQKLELLIPEVERERLAWVEDHFDPYVRRPDPRLSGGSGVGAPLVLVAASDRLGTEDNTAGTFLDFLGVDQAIVLKPYAWETSSRLIYTRESAGATPLVRNLDEGGDGIAPIPADALFRFPVPRWSAEEFAARLGAEVTSAGAAAGLGTIVDAVTSGRVELMPIYGLHNLLPETRATALPALAAGVHAAGLEVPAVVVEIGNSSVDFAPQYTADWLVHSELTDPDLTERIAGLQAGQVLVVRAGRLPQSVFQQMYQLGSLPAVLEGANTANLAQLIGRPFFSALTKHTPYPDADSPGARRLKQVTDAIGHLSPWAQEVTDEPAYTQIITADTALSVLKDLPATRDGLVMSQDEMARLKKILDGEELSQLLGDTPDLAALIRFDPNDYTAYRYDEDGNEIPLTAIASTEAISTVQARILQWRQDHVRELLDTLGDRSVQPPTDQTDIIAGAIAQTRTNNTVLHHYFQHITTQAQHPDNDQLLQAIDRYLDTHDTTNNGKTSTAGKAPERWFRVLPDGGDPRTPAYWASSSGQIQLPDGQILSDDGWARDGNDFIHMPTGMILHGNTGSIYSIDNWEEVQDTYLTLGLVGYNAHADESGLYLEPTEDTHGATTVHLPITEPDNNQTLPTDGMAGHDGLNALGSDRESSGAGAAASDTGAGQDTTPVDPEPPEYTPETVPQYEDRLVPVETIAAVAARLRVTAEQAERLLRYSWFDEERFAAVRDQVGLDDAADLADLVDRIGRIPDDLREIASRLAPMDARGVYQVSREFQIDPRYLELFGAELRDIYSRAAEGRAGGTPERSLDPLVGVREVFESRYAPADKIADFVLVATRVGVSPQELRQIMRERSTALDDLRRMDPVDLLEWVDGAFRARPDHRTVREQAADILHRQMPGKLPQSMPGAVSGVPLGGVSDDWFGDALAEVAALLSRRDGDYDDRVRWATNRARRLVALSRNGTVPEGGGDAAGASAGTGGLAQERPPVSEAEIQEVAERLTRTTQDVLRIADVFGIDPRDLVLFGDWLPEGDLSWLAELDLPSLSEDDASSVTGDDVSPDEPRSGAVGRFAEYSRNLPAFVSLARRTGIGADDLLAVLDMAHQDEGLTLGDLTQMPTDHLADLVRGTLDRLQQVADLFPPMPARDVAWVYREFGVEPEHLWIFGDNVRESYASPDPEGSTPREELTNLFSQFPEGFVTVAIRAGVSSANDLFAVLMSFDNARQHTLDQLQEMAPDDVRWVVGGELSRLREIAGSLAPMSVLDVATVVFVSRVELDHIRVFGPEVQAIYAQARDDGSDPAAAAEHMFTDYAENTPGFHGNLPSFARWAASAQMSAEELRAALWAVPSGVVENFARPPDAETVETLRDELSALRTAADSLAPMTVTDVSRVSRRSGIDPRHLMVFEDGLREIYARGLDPDAALTEVDHLVAAYIRRRDAPRFAAVAARTGIDADDMRVVVEAARDRNMTLEHLFLMRFRPGELLSLAPDLPGFVSVAEHADVETEDLRAVLTTFDATRQGMQSPGESRRAPTLSQLRRMPPEQVREVVGTELTRLRQVADSLAPMSVHDVMDVVVESRVQLGHIEVFAAELRAIYSRAHFGAADEARLMFTEYKDDNVTSRDLQGLAELATRLNTTAADLRAVLTSLYATDGQTTLIRLREMAPDQVREVVGAELSRLRQVADSFAPMSVSDVGRMIAESEVVLDNIGVFGPELQAIYSRARNDGSDPVAAARHMFTEYRESISSFFVDLPAFAESARTVDASPTEMLAVGISLMGRPIVIGPTETEVGLFRLLRDELSALRTAADSLAPMTIADVAQVSVRSEIDPRHLVVFGDGLRAIYARGLDPDAALAEVEKLITEYAPADDAPDFARIAARAEIHADDMRVLVAAASDRSLTLTDLQTMDRSDLLELLPNRQGDLHGASSSMPVPISPSRQHQFERARQLVDGLPEQDRERLLDRCTDHALAA
ncbi:MAG: hypothetical protein ACJ72W_00660, partial [Actinoallomurus sp.]